jgi:prophage regulatory protein
VFREGLIHLGITDRNPSPGEMLLDVSAVAAMLSVSVNTVWTMDSTGRLPSPIRLGRRCTRWRRGEIGAWVKAGCPPRDRWSWGS